MDELRKCFECKRLLPINEFYKYRKIKFFRSCKECFNKAGRKKWKENQSNEEYRQNRRKVANIWLQNHHEWALYAHAKARAKRKKIPFTITLEDVVIPDKCPYLNIPIFKGPKKICDNSPSIDEIVQGLGYVKGNIEVISNKANSMKRNASILELKQFAHSVIRKFGD